MKISIFTNSQQPIGALVEELIATAEDVFIASAYISRKAIDTLVRRSDPSRDADLKRADILFGIDLETDTAALDCLLDAGRQFPNYFHVRYTPNKSGRLFHPKVYYFQCGQASHIIIGSANLTHRGQHINEEMYCYIQCSASDNLVNQLNAIRQAWLAEPFSVSLDAQVVNLLHTMEAAKAAFVDTMSRVGPIIIQPPKLDAKGRLLFELEKGYLISTDFSVAPLSVSVPIREAQRINGANGAVTIRTSLTASVQLLPESTCDDFAQLYRNAKKIVEQHSILVPSGLFYVPPSAQKSFTSSMRSVLLEHKQLIHKHIYLRRPINTHLVQLATDCTKEWQKYGSQPGIVPEEEFLQIAKERIKERREAFRLDPQSAVRLTVNPYPHPLIYRTQNPNHAVWDLCDTKLDDDLLTTLLAILVGQVDAIVEATQKKQQPSVQADLKQAKLLISIRGKSIDDLLAKLNRIANRNWGKASKRGKQRSTSLTPGQLMLLDLAKLRDQAKVHRGWLVKLKRHKPHDAFDLLVKEYSSAGL